MAAQEFDYFVILAGMRTGSNLLEEHLSAFPGIESHGELFNPHFFGKPNTESQFGLSMAAREADPVRVIGAMRSTSQHFPGFRLFYDHDPRAISFVLSDPKAAKIVLTRRPIDSYVSLKIARKTDQWWLSDMTSARAAKVPFVAEEYVEFLDTLSEFQNRIRHSLQISGQTAFPIDYEDLSDPDVITGLGRFLGIDAKPDMTNVRAKVQNPTALSDRLSNPTTATDVLSRLNVPDIEQVPMHEPGRGPGIKFFRACKSAPLLYMPIRGAGFDPIPDWLKAVDPDGELVGGMTQRDLRRWKRQHPGHRSFSVIRHPIPRVHDAFCRFILPADEENYADVRAALIQHYNLPLPPIWPDVAWSLDDHRKAFLSFLKFLKGNLGGQTSIRVDNTWATQDTLLRAVAQFTTPDTGFEVMSPFALSEVYTSDIEKAAEAAYRRDYMMFGFSPWNDGDQAA